MDMRVIERTNSPARMSDEQAMQSVEFANRGNVQHEVFVRRDSWWGGVHIEHDPVVVLVNDGDDNYQEVFRNRGEVEALISNLRKAADEVWPSNEGSET